VVLFHPMGESSGLKLLALTLIKQVKKCRFWLKKDEKSLKTALFTSKKVCFLKVPFSH